MPSFLRAHPFGCPQLESLFRHQLLHRSAAQLLRLLSILVPLQLVLALFRVPHPDLVFFWHAASASLGLALTLAFACSAPSAQHPLVPLCAIWLCSHPILLLPWPSDALLPSLLVIALLYAFFPFSLLSIGLLCSALSVAQLAAMLVVAGGHGFGLAKVIAALLAHIWVHLIGIYALSTGRKINRAVFLNARNALESERELEGEMSRMANLLSGSLAPHVVRSVQSQLGSSEIPRVFVENFGQSSVVFARLYGLPSVLAQLQVVDSARLLNEFEWRLRALAEANGLLLVPSSQSESIVALATRNFRPDHAAAACQFGVDLVALFHSFSTATTAQIQIRVGIGTGSVSTGIVGSRRWHYDVLGMAVDGAIHLEGICSAGAILVSEDTWRRLDGGKFAAERVTQGAWQINGGGGAHQPSANVLSPPNPRFLFSAPPRRFSLLTMQQAVQRLLQQQPPPPRRSSPLSGHSMTAPATPFTKRKGAAKGDCQRVGSCHQLDAMLLGAPPLGLHPITLHFADPKLERTFHGQADRWLIPGLALCVLFLALFGLFQALAMPRMLPNLVTLGLALGLMSLLLLALYANFLESFCQFVTRTALGHSLSILLVLATLCTCGLATTFSCPLEPSSLCQPAQFPAVSLALWMLLSSIFVRLSSLLLLLTLLASLALFSLHLFLTHPSLYASHPLLFRLDLITCLFGFALLLFQLVRRNELLLRMDFLALLKAVDDGRRLERVEFLNEQILLNALPAHIAFNFGVRTDYHPYAHLCPSVGILCARLGRSGDWVGEFGFDRLNRLVCEIDQRMGQLSERRIEKVRTGHCYYTAACGILPELAKNVHDVPCTIGEQLATLADLAEFIQELAESEGLDVAIGLDCGSALSVVVGGDRPRYELLGQPVTRARKLTEAASALGGECVLLSEDVFLALRPRSQFNFDEQSALSVGPGLVAYSLLRRFRGGPPAVAPLPDPPSLPAPLPPPHRGNHVPQQNNNKNEKFLNEQKRPSPGGHPAPVSPRIWDNPLADGRAISASSAQSLCSSELFSVDLSVETDSLELEWVTPEMVANGQYRPNEPSSKKYKDERAGFYSELSVAESQNQLMNAFGEEEEKSRKKWPFRALPPSGRGRGGGRRNSGAGGANISAFGSELSLPSGAQLNNLTAKKVDRMLKEMAGIQQGPGAMPECPFPIPFPMNGGGSSQQITAGGQAINSSSSRRRRRSSSTCQCLSEYENGSRPSLAGCSDSADAAFPSGENSRLERLRRALLRGGERGRLMGGRGGAGGDGNEADRSCSPSMTSSQFLPISRSKGLMLGGAQWRRNSAHSIGYEDEYELASAPLSSYSSSAVSLGWECKQQQELPSVGENALFVPIDADDGEGEEVGATEAGKKMIMEEALRKQMLELSRDICRNFGDFQLSTFSDVEDRNESKKDGEE